MLALHEKRPFTHTPAEIAELAAGVRDPNFRVMLSEEGMHVFNRAGHHRAADPFAFWPLPELEDDAAHAFYLGVELARAQIAWQLGKRYAQDEELRWGAAVAPRPENLLEQKAAGTTLSHRRRRAAKRRPRMICEAVVTSMSSAGQVHIAPMGFREVDGRVVLAPFRPSTTLDNLLATGCAAVNLTDDVRVFAGCLTGRREWPTLPCEQIRCVAPGWRAGASRAAAGASRARTTSGPACTSTSCSSGCMRRFAASTAPRPRSSRRRSW